MTLTVQFYTILAMVISGIWLGIALDTYQRFQTKDKRWSALRFINDILFWILQALFIFYVLLQVNQGEVRVIIFLALLCGFAFYKSLLQSFYKWLLERLIKVVLGFARFLYKTLATLLFRPLTVLFKLLVMFLKIVGRMLYSVLLTIVGIVIFPLKQTGRFVLRFLPTNLRTKLKKIAGLIPMSTNKVKNWIWNKKR